MIALALLLGVPWLLWRDAKLRPSVSGAAWIAAAWTMIYASRPLTSWFVPVDTSTVTSATYDAGNFGEAVVNLVLIVGGLLVLAHRRVDAKKVLADNSWLAVVCLFWTLSILWSDYPLITAKRLFKEFGNIVMVLLILTARDPVETVKAVCLRCTYLCVPLSLLYIRYIPEIGRGYVGHDRSEIMFIGVATHKNTLGALALIGALFLLWDLLQSRGTWQAQKLSVVERVAVLGMCWYIIRIADSATSLLCAILGSALMIALSVPTLRRAPIRIEVCGAGVAALVWIVDTMIDVRKTFLDAVGRDPTLTTRSEVWPLLLQHQESPILGAGFSTFWAGERLDRLFKELGGIIQAHNGYVETYLNGGLVGVGMLGVLLLWGYWRVRRQLVLGAPEAAIRFVVLIVALLYNYSEASFFKLGMMWFVTVYAIMAYSVTATQTEAAPSRREWWMVAPQQR